MLCGNECESVSHVLWECSAYSNSRADFLLKLQEKLGNGFERFDALDSVGKSSFILGSELWEEHFDSLLPLVKEYVVDVWEARKIKLYGDDSSQSQSSTGDLGEFTGIEGQSGKNMCQGGKPEPVCANYDHIYVPIIIYRLRAFVVVYITFNMPMHIFI